MTRPRLEVADVFRAPADEYLTTYRGTTAQRRVLRAVQDCRTAALGGHVETCDQCAHRQIAYNSCRNRHCPKCQGPACARWMQARAEELLPVPYFHLVFTLPAATGQDRHRDPLRKSAPVAVLAHRTHARGASPIIANRARCPCSTKRSRNPRSWAARFGISSRTTISIEVPFIASSECAKTRQLPVAAVAYVLAALRNSTEHWICWDFA